MTEAILDSRHVIGSNNSIYEHNPISCNLSSNRPFHDGMAVAPRDFTNCHVLQA
jgi:hypothetical protein